MKSAITSIIVSVISVKTAATVGPLISIEASPISIGSVAVVRSVREVTWRSVLVVEAATWLIVWISKIENVRYISVSYFFSFTEFYITDVYIL